MLVLNFQSTELHKAVTNLHVVQLFSLLLSRYGQNKSRLYCGITARSQLTESSQNIQQQTSIKKRNETFCQHKPASRTSL